MKTKYIKIKILVKIINFFFLLFSYSLLDLLQGLSCESVAQISILQSPSFSHSCQQFHNFTPTLDKKHMVRFSVPYSCSVIFLFKFCVEIVIGDSKYISVELNDLKMDFAPVSSDKDKHLNHQGKVPRFLYCS